MHNIHEYIDEFSVNGFILPCFGYQTQVVASSFSPQRWLTSVPEFLLLSVSPLDLS